MNGGYVRDRSGQSTTTCGTPSPQNPKYRSQSTLVPSGKQTKSLDELMPQRSCAATSPWERAATASTAPIYTSLLQAPRPSAPSTRPSPTSPPSLRRSSSRATTCCTTTPCSTSPRPRLQGTSRRAVARRDRVRGMGPSVPRAHLRKRPTSSNGVSLSIRRGI